MLRGGRSNTTVTIGGASVVVQGSADANTRGLIADQLSAYHSKLSRDIPKMIYLAQRDHF